jgi:hypothetical protein
MLLAGLGVTPPIQPSAAAPVPQAGGLMTSFWASCFRLQVPRGQVPSGLQPVLCFPKPAAGVSPWRLLVAEMADRELR